MENDEIQVKNIEIHVKISVSQASPPLPVTFFDKW